MALCRLIFLGAFGGICKAMADFLDAVDLGTAVDWWMCPDSPSPPTESRDCSRAVVPGTVFGNFLSSGIYGFEDPYVDDNLQRVPDISQIGRTYYTKWFLADLAPLLRGSFADAAPNSTKWLRFHGINYRSEVFLGSRRIGATAGMFRRYTFRMDPEESSVAGSSAPTAYFLQVRVEPPDFPGANTSSPKCHGGQWPAGQGGDHEIARNGPVMQMSAGWDWIQASPDRNTGIWDRVELLSTAMVRLGDPIVRTRFSRSARVDAKAAAISKADMRLNVEVLIVSEGAADVTAEMQLVDMNGAIVDHVRLRAAVPDGTSTIKFPTRKLRNAHLWWPHAFGEPYLYKLTVSLRVSEGMSDMRTLHVGFREIGKHVDGSLHGPVLSVNHQRLFIRGGNWIGTDQFLRFATDSQRYRDEVALHKSMGLDMIRVWGGGITERSGFYDACDELGMLVWQEFWMSGDNNGRWAGEYSWPDDHSLYLDNAKDVVSMLSYRPSLVLWCAGNELDPLSRNPSPDIRDGLRQLFEADGRPYVLSSMTNFTNFNATFSMAPADGPYTMLPVEDFFKRNPGMKGADNRLLAFQPEIGSSSFPVFSSLKRFLTGDALAAYPDKFENNVHPIWKWHKYEGYVSTVFGDTNLVYSLGVPLDTSAFALQAQIVQFMQYRALFEGFSQFMWEYYSGVLMWKTQAPWPSLRGFLYDWYLHPTGGYYGVREATAAVHAQLDLRTRFLYVVNRFPSLRISGRLRVTSYFLDGRIAQPGAWWIPLNITPNSVAQLQTVPRHAELTVLRLSVYDVALSRSPSISEYLLPPLSEAVTDLHALQAFRPVTKRQRLKATARRVSASETNGRDHVQWYGSTVAGKDPQENHIVDVALKAAELDTTYIFVVVVPLGPDETPALPHTCSRGYFQILPGELRHVTCSSRMPIVSVRLEGWNVLEETVLVSEADVAVII
eukprot:TRINITY_DN55290_c0_g1_i1.p1 TRINITY_DN55290_c0_g1~~TRINITY_DN55290_c0_g1_i1.p1  ORF type:complete len:947 (+),score=85.97 TRINITY_DN55290_c0_g1_i1:64-2904(+)